MAQFKSTTFGKIKGQYDEALATLFHPSLPGFNEYIQTCLKEQSARTGRWDLAIGM